MKAGLKYDHKKEKLYFRGIDQSELLAITATNCRDFVCRRCDILSTLVRNDRAFDKLFQSFQIARSNLSTV